jgi:hypothetical protein
MQKSEVTSTYLQDTISYAYIGTIRQVIEFMKKVPYAPMADSKVPKR